MARRLNSHALNLAVFVAAVLWLASNAVDLEPINPRSIPFPSRPNLQRQPELDPTPKSEAELEPRIQPAPMPGADIQPVPSTGRSTGIQPVPQLGPGIQPAAMNRFGIQPVPMLGPGFEPNHSNPKKRSFSFDIDPKTPIKDLLPTATKAKKSDGPVLTDDLSDVSEVEFQAPAQKGLSEEEQTEKIAYQLAKINHLNSKEEAIDYRQKLTSQGEGALSPYRKASLAALQEMTGKETAPTAAAWRKLLNIPNSE